MTALSSRLDQNWRRLIGEFDYVALEQLLQNEKAKGPIYPKDEEIFHALNSTPFKDVKVVIIGQDPYHGAGQANGLCFSVPKSIDIRKIPPSLKNIYREIEREYGKMPSQGDLTGWASQGVLLLNATLTVREASPGSHQGKGWEDFTDAIIRKINEKKHVVFLLWGRRAQKKRALIDPKHKVLEAFHPSGFSAHRGFLGCGHFRKANADLKKHGLKPVDWRQI
jgi:uracil-DNA glycosylase